MKRGLRFAAALALAAACVLIFQLPAALADSHTHTWTSTYILWRPTCTEEGMGYRYCAGCGTVQYVGIYALGHDWDWVDGEDATCTESGYDLWECSRCGQQDYDYYPAYGHDWETQSQTKATCTQAGSRRQICAECGQTRTTTDPALGHDWARVRVITEATCQNTGTEEDRCSRCGETQTATIPLADHTWGEWLTLSAPTDFTAGQDDHACAVCGTHAQRDVFPDGILVQGDRGDEVKNLQSLLNGAGYDCGTADGIFGGKTSDALVRFEQDNGLEGDGIGWPGIVKALLGEIDLQSLTGARLILIGAASNTSSLRAGDELPLTLALTNIGEQTLEDIYLCYTVHWPDNSVSEEYWFEWLSDIDAWDTVAFNEYYVVTDHDVQAGRATVEYFVRAILPDTQNTVESNRWLCPLTCGSGKSSGIALEASAQDIVDGTLRVRIEATNTGETRLALIGGDVTLSDGSAAVATSAFKRAYEGDGEETWDPETTIVLFLDITLKDEDLTSGRVERTVTIDAAPVLRSGKTVRSADGGANVLSEPITITIPIGQV